MKNVLVPTDFSDNALKATIYAAEMAKLSGAKIHFLHAARMGNEKISNPASIFERYNNLVLEESNGKLVALKELVEHNYGELEIEMHVDPDSDIAEAINNYSNNNHVDLVVMGTQGASGIKSVIIGSVAASVMAQSRIPVLSIPADFMPRQPSSFLFATNHFEEDLTLLNPLAQLINLFSAQLQVAVFLDKERSDAADHTSNMKKMESYTRFLKKLLPATLIDTKVIEGDDVEHALELYSLRNDIDIIALISYPKSFMEKLFQKSVTRKMAFHSKIPVFSIPKLNSENS